MISFACLPSAAGTVVRLQDFTSEFDSLLTKMQSQFQSSLISAVSHERLTPIKKIIGLARSILFAPSSVLSLHQDLMQII